MCLQTELIFSKTNNSVNTQHLEGFSKLLSTLWAVHGRPCKDKRTEVAQLKGLSAGSAAVRSAATEAPC